MGVTPTTDGEIVNTYMIHQIAQKIISKSGFVYQALYITSESDKATTVTV